MTKHPSSSVRRQLPRPSRLLLAMMAAGIVQAHAASPLPAGGHVVSGGVAIGTPTDTTLTITQTTARGIVDWQTFDVGAGYRVNFVQPGAASSTLNRVVGGSPSSIFGRIDATGQVFLVNQNGILFSPTASINVGGLVASTLQISDPDYLAGRLAFSGAGGAVVNQGAIDARFVALAGAQVSNEGHISTPGGMTALVAGGRVSMSVPGSDLLSVSVDAPTAAALVQSGGIVEADGGRVLMSARASNALLDTVVNVGGLVQAHTVGMRDGQIVLDGGASGVVAVSGTLDASGRGAGQRGGAVRMLGENVGLFDNARVDVSGDAGGGMVRVGGDWHGAGADGDANASQVFDGAHTSITADALTRGNGGNVVLWSDDHTQLAGHISARGGAAGGDGGAIETSSHEILSAFGTVDAGASKGAGGRWLIDPNDIVISTNASTISESGGVWANTGDATAQLNNADLSNSLASGTTVVVQTRSVTAHDGDIIVDAPITTPNLTHGQTGTLQLDAQGDILFTSTGLIATTVGAGLDVILNAGTGANGTGAGGVLPGQIAMAAGSSIDTGSGNLVATANGLTTLGDVTVGGNLSVASHNGNIVQLTGTALAVGGLATFDAGTGDIVLTNDGNLIHSVGLIGDSASLKVAGGLSMDSDTRANSLTLLAAGDVSQSVPIEVTGSTTVTTTGGITLGDQANRLGRFSASAAGSTGSITVADAGTLNLGDINGGGTTPIEGGLDAHAMGDIVQTNGTSVRVAGPTSLRSDSGNIFLSFSSNVFDGPVDVFTTGAVQLGDVDALILGDVAASSLRVNAPAVDFQGTASVAGSADVTATTGMITQSGASQLQVGGPTTLSAPGAGGGIVLPAIGNTFGQAVAVNSGSTGQATQLSATGDLTVFLQTVPAGATLVAQGGALSVYGTGGSLALQGDTIHLASAAALTVTGDLDATLNGTSRRIDQVDAVTVSGTTRLDAGDAATGTIALASNGNALHDVAIDRASNVTLHESGAVTITSLNRVTDDAAVTLGSLDLSGQSLSFPSSLTVHGPVTLDAVDALEFRNPVTTTSLTATTTAGSITQRPGADLVVSGTTSLTAGSDISLGNAGNAFTGAVSIDVPHGDVTVDLADSVALTLAGVTVGATGAGGDLALTAPSIAEGNLPVSVFGSTTLVAGQAGIDLHGSANTFVGPVDLTAAAAATIVDAVALDIAGATATTLTLQAPSVDFLGAAQATGNAVFTATDGAITQASAGSVNVGGRTTLTASGTANDILLDVSTDNRFAGTVTATGRKMALETSGALTLGAVAASWDSGDGTSSLSLTGRSVQFTGTAHASGQAEVTATGGSISETAAGALTVAGTTQLTAAGNDILLDTAGGNAFVGAVSASGRDVHLRSDAQALVLADVTATGSGADVLHLQAPGITQGAGTTIQVADGATVLGSSEGIDLPEAGNVFGQGVRVTNDSATVPTVLSATGQLTVDFGASPAGATLEARPGAQGPSSLSVYGDVGSLEVRADAIHLASGGALNVTGDLAATLTASAGKIDQGSAVDVSGTTALDAAGGVIALADSTNAFGDVTVAGATALALHDSGDLVITSLNGVTGNDRVALDSLDLRGQTLSFPGSLVVSGAASLDSVASLAISNPVTAATLALTSEQGTLTQSSAGDLTVSGASTLTAGGDVALSNAGNALSGPVALAVTGGGSTATLHDSVALTLAGVTIGGAGAPSDLALSAPSIAQDGSPVSVSGTTLLQSTTGGIDLGAGANRFVGDVTASSAAALRLADTTALTAHVTATGDASLTAAGDLAVDGTFDDTAELAANGGSLTASGRFAGNLTASAGATDIQATGPLSVTLQTGDTTMSSTGTLAVRGTAGGLTATGTTVTLADAGALAVHGDLDATASDASGSLLQGEAALSVDGRSHLAAPRDITLANADNQFGGAVSASGAGNLQLAAAGALDVTLADIGGASIAAGEGASVAGRASGPATVSGLRVSLGGLQLGGGLQVNAGAGGVGETGAVTATTLSISTPGDVDLGLANAFGGPVTVTARNVTLRQVGDLAATLDDSGATTLAAGGALSVSGKSGALTLEGATISLKDGTSVANDLTLTATGAVDFGATTVGGALGATAGGITQSGALSVGGAARLDAGTQDVALADGANVFGGRVTVSGNDIALSASALDVMVARAAQVDLHATAGDLTLEDVQQSTGLTAEAAGNLLLDGRLASSGVVQLTGDSIRSQHGNGALDVAATGSVALRARGNVGTLTGDYDSGSVIRLLGATAQTDGAPLTVDFPRGSAAYFQFGPGQSFASTKRVSTADPSLDPATFMCDDAACFNVLGSATQIAVAGIQGVLGQAQEDSRNAAYGTENLDVDITKGLPTKIGRVAPEIDHIDEMLDVDCAPRVTAQGSVEAAARGCDMKARPANSGQIPLDHVQEPSTR